MGGKQKTGKQETKVRHKDLELSSAMEKTRAGNTKEENTRRSKTTRNSRREELGTNKHQTGLETRPQTDKPRDQRLRYVTQGKLGPTHTETGSKTIKQEVTRTGL